MKFTLKEVRMLERSLFKITQLKLPIKISYRLAKLLKFCIEELSHLEKARLELVKNHPDVDGEPSEEFLKEFTQLLEEEVECLLFEPFEIEDLGDIGISTVDMVGLLPIIKDEKEKGI